MPAQVNAFLDAEGDSYYIRNKNKEVITPAKKLLADWLLPHKHNVCNILEIGAGNGISLSYLANSLEAKGVGVEPSRRAVQDWNSAAQSSESNSSTKLFVGDSAHLNFPDSSFDVVGFGFCLYLVDRHLLFRSYAEADRVLKDGGFLYIQDFDPSRKYSNKYSHYDGLYSYKSDYTSVFVASGHYVLVSKFSYSHSAFEFNANYDERVSINLLYKQEKNVYER